jgi:MFS family permease
MMPPNPASTDVLVASSVPAETSPPVEKAAEKMPAYAYYSLAVLTFATFFNFLDRMILSILAHDIRNELGLDDVQLGFLLGTGFAVFYAVVGIAMGRIADAVSRTKLMAIGFATWSAMTALGGAAVNFGMLGLARIGVGIGEATANPCSHSLISDYFSARNRSTALGTYIAGTFLGSAGAMVVGGLILSHWSSMCHAVPGDFACNLSGWRATLFLVGLPGLPLALLVYSLREPPRPPRPPIALGTLLSRELGAAIPPFTLITLYRSGNRQAFITNVMVIAAVIAAVYVLIALTGDRAQWCAIGLGAYSVVSWGQVLKIRDLPFYRLTFGCPTFALAMFGGALVATSTGAVMAWAAPYAIRVLNMAPASAGIWLGITTATSGGIGVIVAGRITDYWKQRDPRAPIGMAALSLLCSLPALVLMLRATTPNNYIIGAALFSLCASGWAGAFAAMIQDLVLPRMRGGAASAFALISVIIASGAGPYWVGKVSTVSGSLATGMASIQLLAPIALVLLFLAARRLRHENPLRRLARAQAAGEPGIA